MCVGLEAVSVWLAADIRQGLVRHLEHVGFQSIRERQASGVERVHRQFHTYATGEGAEGVCPRQVSDPSRSLLV